jgi:hypothetical protein
MFTNVDVFTPNIVTNYAKNNILRQCICGKDFNSRQSLYMHKKRNNCSINVYTNMENESVDLHDKDLIKLLIKENVEYNKIIMETMGGGLNVGEKNKEKIIRNIVKEVVIDKE